MDPAVKYLIKCYLKTGEGDESEDQMNSSASQMNAGLRVGYAATLMNIAYPNARGEEFVHAVYDLVEAMQRPREPVLDANQRQNIRAMAVRLRAAAYNFQYRRNQPMLAIERGILQNEELNQEERAAVDAMHAAQDDASIFTIAGYINKCLTSKTLKAALRYLSYSASSKDQELAIACELASILFPKIYAVPSRHSIFNVIEEFMEDRLGSGWYTGVQC